MDEERWKQIDGFADYDVSNHGRVRSRRLGETRILKPWKAGPEGKQYLCVWLCGEQQTKAKIAHLVAEAFVGPRLPRLVTNHINGDKTNNHFQNLEWVTYGENNLHAYRVLGRKQAGPRGEQCHTAVLTDVTARRMLVEMQAGIPVRDLLEPYGVDKATAYRLKRGDTWKHIHQELGG